MRYHAFNIGQPVNLDWWKKLRGMGAIVAGFEGIPGDRGDAILRGIDQGDWVIAYANGQGFVGAGVAAGPATYRLVKNSGLAPDWNSDHVHLLDVEWRYYVETLKEAVSFKQVNWHAPRQTKELIHDVDSARRLVDLLRRKNTRGARLLS